MIRFDSPILTASQAAKVAGCTDTYMRRLLDSGNATGYYTGTVWLMELNEALRVRGELTVRSIGKRKGGE
jgi:hypothetical protein